jgi:hypothetical protein
MWRALVTGMSGTGKWSALAELADTTGSFSHVEWKEEP